MSSLAASRADNFYFPPEWRPEMGSISKFQGSSGSNQYEKYGIIRFELPFDAWCLGCGRHMSKGLRFNAKKDRAGKYFTTTIYSFDMKCYSCEQRFEIKTDPKNRTYDYVSGLRKHEQDYEANAEEGIVEVGNDEVRQKIDADPMFKLQHHQEDYRRTQTARDRLEELQELQDETHRKDYDVNALLRSKNRKKRALENEELQDGKRRGFNIRLVATTPAEERSAKSVVYRKDVMKLHSQEAYKRAKIQTESIFSRSKAYSKPKQSGPDPSVVRSTLLHKVANGDIIIPKV
jgi:coiled-coil domain-containing protein 130